MQAPDQPTPDPRRLTPVRLESADWSPGPIVLLTTRKDRRVGLRPLPGPFGVLLRTRSIHTLGMQTPIGVVVLSSEGIVIRAAVVPPHRVIVAMRARWMLEVAPSPLPEVGSRLVIRDS